MIYEKRADATGHLLFEKYDAEHVTKYSFMPHFHSSVELYLCVSGKHRVNIGGTVRDIEAGEMAFVDKFTPHTSGTPEGEEPATVYVVVASAKYLENIEWLARETLPAFTKYHEGFEKIKQLFEWAYDQKSEMNEEMKCGFVTLLLGVMHKYCGGAHRISEKNTKLLVNVMSYIDEHYAEKISLELLSELFGYEPTYLSRSFNKFLGMNLREYINRRRVSAVIRMRRENPDMPVWKAADACGFDSPNTYYRAMDKYKKMTSFET